MENVNIHLSLDMEDFLKMYLERAFPASAPAGTVVVSEQAISDLREKIKALRQQIGTFNA
jgi:hypothetical protein